MDSTKSTIIKKQETRSKEPRGAFRSHSTLNCRGRLLDLTEPKVMGILNLSPDSFFDGAKVADERTMLERVNTMLTAGATIIDVGGMSTRPGAEVISEEEELERVIPTVTAISREFPDAIISVDTTKAEVARQAVSEGAVIVNDISAGNLDQTRQEEQRHPAPRHPELVSGSPPASVSGSSLDVIPNHVSAMWTTVAELKVPYVLMHMQGTPADMQKAPQYDDVVLEVVDFLSTRVHQLRQLGVHDIIIDPGFGFGKTIDHNYKLLANLEAFKMFELPILVGLSRKSMVGKALGVSPIEALNGTTALHVLALLNGATILRVHDVKEAVEAVKLFGLYGEQV